MEEVCEAAMPLPPFPYSLPPVIAVALSYAIPLLAALALLGVVGAVFPAPALPLRCPGDCDCFCGVLLWLERLLPRRNFLLPSPLKILFKDYNQV